MPDFQKILNTIYEETKHLSDTGKVATYIPELASISGNKFGICLLDIEKKSYHIGDFEESFSVQSISKVLTLAMAMSCIGEKVWDRVDVEPSGDPFNHLSLLEQENGIPRNPLINAGAIVIADILVSELKEPKKDFLAFVRQISGDPTISYDENVAKSEKATGFKNYAAANLLKSYGNLKNDVLEVLDFYFYQCSLSMSCSQLCNTFYLFINRGKCRQQQEFLTVNQVKRINALMLTCGFYDEAGEFAFRVGLPGKSGVGGGIVALLPKNFCVAVWSPGLNKKGNSTRGMAVLERLTTLSDLSIF
ncbi:glutaminase [Maribacter cobaltidurans]|uniref:Glutaminase n=1 Tax=Maribacter cobaltidurans TaxID=1178778 RepID=A0A223V830_9FLAO|nr:glutaminase [Maribacter cobaltidurans]ASV31452.1 glutaminase [Maribacter cobaltidurans]GGD82150.1 glutaminase [Maribacter cobaltidurans]